MTEIFTAKVPITYTENVEENGVQMENTSVIGYLFTPNLLMSMSQHKERVNRLVKK